MMAAFPLEMQRRMLRAIVKSRTGIDCSGLSDEATDKIAQECYSDFDEDEE